MTRCFDHTTRHRHRRSDAARTIADLIRSDVMAGRYDDRPLPMESELVRAFGVSRNTVRDALSALRDEGLLERRQGAGTFSVAHKALHHFDRLHAVASSTGSGRNRRYQLIDAAVRPAPERVATHLGVVAGDDVVHLERVMVLDGEPFSLRSSWMPADLAAPLLNADLRWDHIYELVRDALGMELRGGELVVEATVAGADVAPLLGVAPGAPLFYMTHATEASDGRPVEYGFTRTRGDRLALLSRLPMEPIDPLGRLRTLVAGEVDLRADEVRRGGVTP
ncbi:MAG: GntR family transcriptional regulator [Acidimicrobiales bacterium]